MTYIFEVYDKTKRRIYLTEERWHHILKHPEMYNIMFEEMIMILQYPIAIKDYKLEENVKYYYGYFKNRTAKAKYLRIIVKYLNGKGFIITAYFIEAIQ